MTSDQLLDLGAWQCPICGAYRVNGYYFKQHLNAVHGIAGAKASEYMLAMCEAPLVPFRAPPIRFSDDTGQAFVMPVVGQMELLEHRQWFV